MDETRKKYSYGDCDETLEPYEPDKKNFDIRNFLSEEKIHKEEMFIDLNDTNDSKKYIINLKTEPNRFIILTSVKINIKTKYKSQFRMYLNIEFDNGEMVTTENTYKGEEEYEFTEKFKTSTELSDYFTNNELIDIFNEENDYFNSNSIQVMYYEKLLKSKNHTENILREKNKIIPKMYYIDYNDQKMIKLEGSYLKILKHHFENHIKKVNFLKTEKKNPEYTKLGKERILSCLLKPENFIIISLEKEDSETKKIEDDSTKIEKCEDINLQTKKSDEDDKNIKEDKKFNIIVIISYIIINKNVF